MLQEKEKERNLLLFIEKLPSDITKSILNFLPTIVSVFIDKKSYIDKHSTIKKYILKDQYENYIRSMIRQDNHFVFENILRENFYKWILYKRYTYKITIFSNYIYFLLEFCIENKSDNCKNIINEYLKKSGLSKNQHKKNTHKNIRWTN